MPSELFTIPEAARRLGLAALPTRDKQRFCSPFRPDKHPGCWLEDSLTTFCDFGAGIARTGVHGFVALFHGFPHQAEQRTADQRAALDQWFAGNGKPMDPKYYEKFGSVHKENFPAPRPKNMAFLDCRLKPEETPRIEKATQLLATLRKLPVTGVRLAVQRGLVIFGAKPRPNPVPAFWGLYDGISGVLSVRRIDGQLWSGTHLFNAHKAHTPGGFPGVGWWGIMHLKSHHEEVILCEGAPDYLAAHCLIAQGIYPEASTAVIAALNAHSRLDATHLEMLRGRTVYLAPQRDEAYLKAAVRWKESLQGVAFEVATVPLLEGCKDLNDSVSASLEDLEVACS